MMMDNCRPTQVVTPIAVAISNVVLLLEQSNMSPGTWYTALDLANFFSSILANKIHQIQFVFSWQGQQYTFAVLLQGYINSLALS